MTDPEYQPALHVLGDQLEAAASRASAAGGVPPGRSRWSRAVLLPALGVFAVVAIAAALLIPGDSRSAEATVRAAAQQTVAASTGRFEVTMSMSGVPDMGDADIVMTGAYDIAADRFETTLEFSDLAALGGEDLLGMGDDASMTVLVDGDTVYLRFGGLGGLLGLDQEWVKLDLAELGAQFGTDGDLGTPGVDPGTVDPSGFLEALEELGGDVTEVGREDLRGVATTHYRGQIDLQAAYDGLPDDDRGQLDQLFEEFLPGATMPALPVDVWVGDDGFVRRIEVSLDLAHFGSIEGTTASGEVSVAIEYFDLGAPVEISPPPPDQVADLGDVLGGLGGMLFGELGELDFDGGLEGLGEDLFGDLDLDELEAEFDQQFGDLFEEFDAEGFDLDGLLDDLDLDGLEQELDELFGDGSEPTPSLPGPPTA